MRKEKWTPGHAINKGYPYLEIVTEAVFPNRVKVGMDENGMVAIDYDKEVFPADIQSASQKEQFLLHRLFDFSEALKVAEDQIRTLLEEEPFIPEEFGFEVIAKPVDFANDSPVRVYASKFDPKYTLYREVQDISSGSFAPENWVLMKKNEDGSFSEIRVKLPCHRIAYALFYGLGVKVEEDQHEAQKAPVEEMPPVKEMELFDVTFERGDAQAIIPKISAIDEKDAMTKAMFLFQTDDFYENVPKDIDFKDLKVEKHEKVVS